MAGEIYRNGIKYGGSDLPLGGIAEQVLIKNSNNPYDVRWGEIGGAVFVYEVGNTPFSASWLSLTPNGSPLTPNSKLLYLIVTSGDYYNNLVRWDSTGNVYLPITSSSGGTGGVVFSYIVGNVPLASSWLSDEVGGSPIIPEEGILYLVLTNGIYKNIFYRYDETNHIYVEVLRCCAGSLAPLFDDTIDYPKDAFCIYDNQLYKFTAPHSAGGWTGLDVTPTTITEELKKQYISAYIVGETEFASDWLSLTASGTALTPNTYSLYIVCTEGDYKDVIFRYDDTEELYKQLSGAAGGHTIVSDGEPLPQRNVLELTDFDAEDDDVSEKTLLKPHLLSESEFNEIFEQLPPSVVTDTGSPVHFAESRWLRFNPRNRKGLIIKGGTRIKKSDGTYAFYDSDYKIDFSSETLVGGKDYFINLADNGTFTCAQTKLTTGVTIGRFHTLCEDVGDITMKMPVSPSSSLTEGDTVLVKSYSLSEDKDFYDFYNKEVISVTTDTAYDTVTVNHPLSGYEEGDILPESIFCQSFRPDSTYEDAMVYDRNTGIFVDIYLQSGTGLNTRSAFNANHVVGRQQPNHLRDLQAVGKRLLTETEFYSIALGSNEQTNIVGSEDKTTVGGHSDTSSRRMISAIGCEECCGYLWQWLDYLIGWQSLDWFVIDGKGDFGKEYGDLYPLIAGGGYDDGDRCGTGSRCAGYVKSSTAPNVTARGCTTIKPYQQASTPITIINGSGGGGSAIATIAKADWDAMTLQQKRNYSNGLVAVYNPIGNVTMYYPSIMPETYLIYSTPSKVICEATAGTYSSGDRTWGIGSSPITFAMTDNSSYASYISYSSEEQAVYLGCNESGNKLRSYCTLSSSKSCTAYIIAKQVESNRDTPCVFGVCDENASYLDGNNSAVAGDYYNGPLKLFAWNEGGRFTPNVNANTWFGVAFRVDGVNRQSKAIVITPTITTSFYNVNHGVTGQRIGLANFTGYTTVKYDRTDANMYVRYFGLVDELETEEVMQNNLTALVEEFLADQF